MHPGRHDRMQDVNPPKWAHRVLVGFLRSDLVEEVEGDLEEKFYRELKSTSTFRAKCNYWYQVINYLRPFAIRKSAAATLNTYDMFQNYFKIAWRSLAKQRMYSIVKIGGFAIGITACFLIALYIADEVSYDRQFPYSNRTFRVVGVFNDNGNIQRDVYFPAPFTQAILDDYPEVDRAGRINAGSLFGAGNLELRRADREENLFEEGFTYADQGFLDVVQIPFIYGSREHALEAPKSIVISKQKADKYFPNEDPIGKQLILNDDESRIYTVTGVMDNSKPSHLPYQFLITLEGVVFYPGEQTNWGASNYPTYIRLKEGTDVAATEQKMTKGVLEKYVLPMLIADGVPNAKDFIANAHLEFQPIRDIHLRSQDISDGLKQGDILMVWLFGAIAVFILLIACINFINLSTARSANRAKEVGLRKTVGSLRSHLINQFLVESVLLSLVAFAIGISLAGLLLPYFNTLADKSLSFPWATWWVLPVIFGAAIVVGVFAGMYPAIYLSSFKPIQVLKGQLSAGSKRSPLRNSLVVFQFTTSIILIVSTFVVYRQMQFILNTKVGFDKEHVLMLQGVTPLGEKVTTLKAELSQLSQVKQVSVSDYLPVEGTKRNGNSFWKEGRTKIDPWVGGQFWQIDADYIPTLGMKISAGRNFKIDMPTDSQAVIINQAMAKELSLSGDGVGERITNGATVWSVVGVVENFHFESMRSRIEPVAMVLGNSPSIVAIRIDGSDTHGSIEAITQVWKKFAPNQAIRFSFLNERYENMYADVERTGWIFSSFSIFAIGVACLGLFALSAFMTEQRSKEISIRIVLGASLKQLLTLLTRNFVVLVIISFIIAVPVSWYIMDKWLEAYVYKISITWDIFLIAGTLTLLIALLTISYQSVRAALMNPISSLRSE